MNPEDIIKLLEQPYIRLLKSRMDIRQGQSSILMPSTIIGSF